MFSLTLSFTLSVDFSHPDKKPLTTCTPSPIHSPPIVHPSTPLPHQRPYDNLSPPRPPHPEPLNPQARHPSLPPSPMHTKPSHQPFYPADASSASLSPAAQKLQQHTREDIHQRRARENGASDDSTTLRILDIATRGLVKPSAGQRPTGRLGLAGSESPAGSSHCFGGDDRGRRRMRSPRRFGSTTASTSPTTGASDSETWTSEFSLVDAETVLREQRRRDGRGVSEQQVYSPFGVRVPTATRTTTGVAAGTRGNDKDDEDDDEEEGWDFLTTPPPSTPSTTDPLLTFPRDGDESLESFALFRRSGKPSPSSRSGIVSTSSSDQNWMEGFLHHQEKKDEVYGQESPLPSASEQEKHQHRFPAVEQFIKTKNRERDHTPSSSSSSSSSASQHRKEPQQAQDLAIDHHEDKQHSPLSGSKTVSQQASSKAALALRRRYTLDEETKQERGVSGKNRTQSQGDLDSSGSSDGDGWGFAGGGGELREQGDEGEDYGWEMV